VHQEVSFVLTAFLRALKFHAILFKSTPTNATKILAVLRVCVKYKNRINIKGKMNSLQRLESNIMKWIVRTGYKLLSKYLAIYRIELSSGTLLLRLGFFDVNFNDLKSTYDINKTWLEGGSS